MVRLIWENWIISGYPSFFRYVWGGQVHLLNCGCILGNRYHQGCWADGKFYVVSVLKVPFRTSDSVSDRVKIYAILQDVISDMLIHKGNNYGYYSIKRQYFGPSAGNTEMYINCRLTHLEGLVLPTSILIYYGLLQAISVHEDASLGGRTSHSRSSNQVLRNSWIRA